MKKSEIVYIFILFLSFFPAAALFSQADQNGGRVIPLVLTNSVWTVTMNGNALCPPVTTSYGFAVLSDARMILACSSSGTVLWQRPVSGRPDHFLSVLDGDFLMSVSGGHTVHMINPSGCTVWSADTSSPVIQAPLQGDDGRIYVCGTDCISCWSMTGICKWKTPVSPFASLPLSELNDGTILVFTGDDTALRISPYGEQLETVTFSGHVTAAAASPAGVLVAFSGGGAGLCSVKNGRCTSIWAVPSSDQIFSADGDSSFLHILVLNGTAAFIQHHAGGTRAVLYRLTDGTKKSELIFSDIETQAITYAYSKTSGIGCVLLADDEHARCVSADGTPVWNAHLPDRKSGPRKWDYLLYTPTDELVFFTGSWAVTAFRMMQHFGNKPPDQFRAPSFQQIADISILSSPLSYTGQLDDSLTNPEMARCLNEGLYGAAEKQWWAAVQTGCTAYLSELKSTAARGTPESSSFTLDTSGTDALLSRIPLFGTKESARLTASLITAETNSIHLRTLLRNAALCPYDPDGLLLDSTESALFKLPAKDDASLTVLCDTVYALCRFMGRPAFYAHGKKILSRLLLPQYSTRVQEKARKTLIRIADAHL